VRYEALVLQPHRRRQFRPVAVILSAQEKVDLAVIQRIKAEAFQSSKVMDHLFWITDV